MRYKGADAFLPYDLYADYGELPDVYDPRLRPPEFRQPEPRYGMREFLPNFDVGPVNPPYPMDPEPDPDPFHIPLYPEQAEVHQVMMPRNRRLETVPPDWTGNERSRRERLLLSSMENDMPQNAPYPGESEEQFLARMAAQAQPDPRAMALSRMMSNPATNPANTMHMGRTTENYLDPMMAQRPFGMDQQQMAPDLLPMHSLPAMGQTPVEEMMTNDPSFGGDGSMLDAYGPGADSYAGARVVPGPEATPMQRRNRAVAGDPDPLFDVGVMEGADIQIPGSDEYDEETPASRFKTQRVDEGERVGPDGDGPKTQSTEDELDMVQRTISTSDIPFSGNEEEDREMIEELMQNDGDTSEIRSLIERFEQQYGYNPFEDDQDD